MDFILHLPTWQIIRSFGVVSYALLSIGMCMGILYGFPFWSGRQKSGIYKWHTLCTNTGTLIGLLHGVITVIDTYMPFGWAEILVPFTAKNHPVLNGLGTLAGYGMLTLVFTSDFRNKIGKKVWLAIHLMSYPIFVLAFIHGFFEGTDSGKSGIQWMYASSIIILLLLTLLRGMVREEGKTKSIVRIK